MVGGKKLKEAAEEIESDRDYGNYWSILFKINMETMHAIYLGNAWVRTEKCGMDKEIKKMKKGWTQNP